MLGARARSSVASRCMAASTSAAGARPRAAATNKSRTAPARPSAPASNSAVSLRAVRLTPRSRSLTDRGLRPAASASSSCVSLASARSCRSNPPNPSAGCCAIFGIPSAGQILPRRQSGTARKGRRPSVSTAARLDHLPNRSLLATAPQETARMSSPRSVGGLPEPPRFAALRRHPGLVPGTIL